MVTYCDVTKSQIKGGTTDKAFFGHFRHNVFCKREKRLFLSTVFYTFKLFYMQYKRGDDVKEWRKEKTWKQTLSTFLQSNLFAIKRDKYTVNTVKDTFELTFFS